MSKFKVGDRVITTVRPYCMALEKGQELTITDVGRDHGPARERRYRFDDTDNGVYETEIELVPTLFRKGDKVLVEYTVTQDQASNQVNISVSSPGLNGTHLTLSLNQLREGAITRAPEPPYVPEVGDRFKFGKLTCPYTLVFIDAKSLVYETPEGGRGYSSRYDTEQYTKVT
jgi:hypothetical protein